jgi:PAS domain S-box-containing protein
MADLRPVPPSTADYLRSAFLASPAMMAITRLADGVLLDANPAFLEGAGLSREQAIGRPILDLGIWLDDSRRVEYRRLLQTEGRVKDYEARFRNHQGREREVMLNAELVTIDGERCGVVVAIDVTERRQREREQTAVYRLAAAAAGATDLRTLLERFHAIIAELLPARNFFVALLNPERTELSFPVFVDEVTPPPAPRPVANYLSDFVIRTRQPLLLRSSVVPEFKATTGYAPRYGWCKVWLGAPLMQGDVAVGAVAVQDYHDENAYREDDVPFFGFVAAQIATALRRYEAEAVRRESEEYFAKSFHASPARMALAGLEDGRIIEANQAFLEASGYTREEVIGRTSLELKLWANTHERVAFIERLTATGAVRDHEAMFRPKTGEPRYVLVNADAFEMRGRRCMLITAIDLTERHRRERVQEATYRISQAVLAGGSLDALFAELHRIVGTLMPARNFYVALLSPDHSLLTFPYFVDEVVAEAPPRPPANGFTEYILRTGRPALMTAPELHATLAAHGDYLALERPAAQRLGAPLFIDGRPAGVIALQDYENALAYGAEELRLLMFVADQAALAVQRRQADEAMRRAEEQYRGIFEHAVEGLYQTTVEGRFLRANRAMAQLLGYDSVAALVAGVNDIGHQVYADPGRRAQFMELIRGRDAIADFESDVRRADGTVIRLSESIRVVRNAAGEISHFEGVAIDITAVHEHARALREARDAADTANRAKSQFLASMSHELRTPLNGILGYAQILRRDPALTDPQRAGVEVIQQSGEHLLALINDVLDLAKIEARRFELHPVDFDLPDFVRGVSGFFLPRAREKGLLFETALSGALPRVVRGDIQRLRQVCYNLLGNAIKFTQRGSVIFSIERAEGMVRFSVSDTGPGISAADLERLFEPFAQIGDHARHAEGTGLGLNVSRGIVEQPAGAAGFTSTCRCPRGRRARRRPPPRRPAA